MFHELSCTISNLIRQLFTVVISIFQLVIVVVLNIDIVSYKCCIISYFSLMCWDLLLVISYFDYILKGKNHVVRYVYFSEISGWSQDRIYFKFPFWLTTWHNVLFIRTLYAEIEYHTCVQNFFHEYIPFYLFIGIPPIKDPVGNIPEEYVHKYILFM